MVKKQNFYHGLNFINFKISPLLLKKPITILLLFILFFSQIGYRFVHLIQQHQLKEEAEEQLLSVIDDQQFDQICLQDNLNNLVWEEAGKEFSLNGQMYDVAKTKIIHGKTILFCLNDEKEEQLIEDMLKKIQSGNDSGPANKHAKHIIKFQLSDFTLIITKSIINNFFVTREYPDYAAAIHAAVKEVYTPPPNNNLC